MLILLTYLISVFVSVESPPKTGKELINEMYEEYEGKWYNSLTFEQKTTFYNADEEAARVQTWYEAMRMPDKLAIKIDDWSAGNGMIFKNDSLYQMRDGGVANSTKLYHPLLILGFSVYTQPAQVTIGALEALKFDLSKIYTTEWQGKKVYVVGAEEGDTTSNQFWVEADTKLFVRLLQGGGTRDTRFNKYEKLGGGWIAPEVIFYTNGKMTMKEEYSKIKTPHLDSEIFNPEKFKTVKW